jgi:hypothetical protein
MSKKKSELKALQEYCSRIWTDEDWRNADDDFINESDRSLIILMSTRVEDALQVCVEEAMPRISKRLSERLFSPLKPLSTFSSRIDIANALGIIENSHAKNLHFLREIRNQCAHAKQHLSFEIPELRAASELIAAPEIRDLVTKADDRDTARTNFLGFSSYLIAYLFSGKQESMEAFNKLFVSELDD